MNNELLKVGIIGLGVGERHISGYQENKRCSVVKICDFDPKKIIEVSKRYPNIAAFNDPKSILNDPEIGLISIASYDNFHCEQILAAIDNGKHIFVEKPLCLSFDEYNKIQLALERNPHIKISSNLILRLEPRFSELSMRIKRGDIGKIYYIEGDYDYGRLHKLTSGWRGKIPYYSVVYGGAIHLIDMILWLSSAKPVEVFGYGNRISTQDTSFKHLDFVSALIKFDDTSVAKITANFGSVTPHGHKLCIYGTKGTFIHGHDGAYYFSSRDPMKSPESSLEKYPSAAKGDMLTGFVDSILDGVQQAVSKEEVLSSMHLALSIEKSLEIGERIKL
jgi:predicted dehydrogenase